MSPHRTDPYFCIVALPGQPVADLFVLQAADDAGALRQAAQAATGCSGWLAVEVFQGERPVGQLVADGSSAALAAAA